MSGRQGSHDGSAARFGIVEWFRPGEYQRATDIMSELRGSGAAWLRTHLSWAEYLAPGGPEWFDWLLPKLAANLELLPCIHYTPPSLSRSGKTSGAPARLQDYADFVDHVLTRYGRHFRHVELWNEPNNLLDWDWRDDPEYHLFCEMVGAAAYWTQKRGWHAVLAGPSPFDPVWVDLMGKRGLLDVVSAVGIHGFPGTWDSEEGSWQGWDRHLADMRRVVDRYNPQVEIWITETGYSTWRSDEIEQARRFAEVVDVSAERFYWYGWRDIPQHVAVQEGHLFDIRHYHFGMADKDGRSKVLARLLADGGIDKVRQVVALAQPAVLGRAAPVLITGGSGFIGSNLADSLLADGGEVIVLDNLSRPGVEQNLEWLKERHGARVHAYIADLRDPQALDPVAGDICAAFHLAAQTAVTTSMVDPADDFEVNARGTLNMLEGIRRSGRKTPVVFSSTNKVYGALEDLAMVEIEDRYVPADRRIREHGVGEERPLDFCTPYGCSKGAADQYVLDYASSFKIPTAVLRMSCIYGPRQFGTEDQGWVAHFLIRALEGLPITIFGDGKQVRDVLHVSDAVAAYRKTLASISGVNGEAFNLGGGPANAVSLRLVLREIAALVGDDVTVRHEPWRPGDQYYFVADTRRIQERLGWKAAVSWRAGIRDLADWLRSSRGHDEAKAIERMRA